MNFDEHNLHKLLCLEKKKVVYITALQLTMMNRMKELDSSHSEL